MIRLLRSILKTFTSGKYNSYTGTGRADEQIGGILAQHYGFYSIPSKGTEVYALQFGNNNVSIAENDGEGKTASIARVPAYLRATDNQEANLPTGSVAIYTPMQDNNDKTLAILLKPGATPILYQVAENGQIAWGADNVMIQVDDKTKVTTRGATPLTTYALVNVNWLYQQYSVHTHSGGTISGNTGVPNPGVIPTLPETTTKLESA